MINRPKFGQWVSVPALARKHRKPLGDDPEKPPFKTEWVREELDNAIRGVFIGTKNAKEGITDLYGAGMVIGESGTEQREGHYHFRPQGPVIELWIIATESMGELLVFPADVKWRKPITIDPDAKFKPGDLIEVNENYAGEEYWGRLGLVFRSSPMFTNGIFVDEAMMPYEHEWCLRSEELDLAMEATELELAYPGYFDGIFEGGAS